MNSLLEKVILVYMFSIALMLYGLLLISINRLDYRENFITKPYWVMQLVLALVIIILGIAILVNNLLVLAV